MQHIKLVIFDLDGTLLNTIADLAHSTNHALKQTGFPIHPIEAYKLFVGNGINKLFERALPESSKTQENILRIREAFIPYYDEHNTDHTTPYEGIPELLKIIQSKEIQIAIASNKYQSATEKLVKTFFPNIQFSAIFGQQDNIPIKPDPTVVYNILKIAKATTKDTLYVGDSGTDMQTATNSNTTSIGVTWGFRPRSELEEFKASYIVKSTDEILKIIDKI